MTARMTDREGFYRRDFLRLGAAGLFGLGLPELLRLEAAAAKTRKADSVIFLWLSGGPATIDMWDLKPDAPDGIRGEFKPVATKSAGVRVCEHLPKMAGVMDKCTLVRSLTHTIPDHGLAATFVTTGNRPTPVLRYPSLGSLTARLSPAAPGAPPFVSFRAENDVSGIGSIAGYLGPAYDPFTLEVRVVRGRTIDAEVDTRGIALPTGFTLEQLDNRNGLVRSFDRAFAAADRGADLLGGLDAFQRQALDILRSRRTRDASDLGRESAPARDRYGRTPFGQGCLAARRLVEAGVRFVTVSTGAVWDTHGQNFSTLRTQLLPSLDQTLSALLQDLDDRGLLDRTIVYCAGEFGRTPKINKGAGRDHWARSMAVVLAGGGFRRGYAHGSTDARGMAPVAEPCTPDDVAATICHRLGIDPHQELQTPSGRPVQLFREGRVLLPLVT
jgi:hypothetical protein